MKRFRKYESEDIENVENDLDEVEELDDVESEDEDLEEDDVESSEDDLEEDSENEEDSISFSTEINGVRYSGTLYRDDSSEDEDDVAEEEDEEAEDEVDEDQEDDDLILQSEEELDSLDFPEGLDESVIKAKARIYGKRYNVSFCDVKRESVKRAKIEMRRHNIVEAWNSLVRGAKYIKC